MDAPILTPEQLIRRALIMDLAFASRAILQCGWNGNESTKHTIPKELTEASDAAEQRLIENIKGDMVYFRRAFYYVDHCELKILMVQGEFDNLGD